MIWEDREEAIDIARTFRVLLIQNIDLQLDI